MGGGLLVGLSNEDAARYGFLLATPIIGAAALLKLPDLFGTKGDGVRGPALVGRAVRRASRPTSRCKLPAALPRDQPPDPVRHLLHRRRRGVHADLRVRRLRHTRIADAPPGRRGRAQAGRADRSRAPDRRPRGRPVRDAARTRSGRAGSVAYDAIVLDVGLPGITGSRPAGACASEEIWSPVLMLTARDAVAGPRRGPRQRRRRLPRQAVLVRRAARAAARAGPPRRRRAPDRCWRSATCGWTRPVARPGAGSDGAALRQGVRAARGASCAAPARSCRASPSSSRRGTELREPLQRRRRLRRALRDKIDRPFGTDSIETVRGVGYRLRAPSTPERAAASGSGCARLRGRHGRRARRHRRLPLPASATTSTRASTTTCAARAATSPRWSREPERSLAPESAGGSSARRELAQVVDPSGRVLAATPAAQPRTAQRRRAAAAAAARLHRPATGPARRARPPARRRRSRGAGAGRPRRGRRPARARRGARPAAPRAARRRPDRAAARAPRGLRAGGRRAAAVEAMRRRAADISADRPRCAPAAPAGARRDPTPRRRRSTRCSPGSRRALRARARVRRRGRPRAAHAAGDPQGRARLALHARRLRSGAARRAPRGQRGDRPPRPARRRPAARRALRRGPAALQHERIDADDLLESVRNRFAWRAEADGRSLETEAPPGLELTGDRLRLEQALGNLVENALRHGAGTVRIEARATGDRGGAARPRRGRRLPARLPPPRLPALLPRAGRPQGRGRGARPRHRRDDRPAHGGAAHVENGPQRGAEMWIVLPSPDGEPFIAV